MKLKTFIKQYGAAHRAMLMSGPLGPDAAIVVKTAPEFSIAYMREALSSGEDYLILYKVNEGKAVAQTKQWQQIVENLGIDATIEEIEDLCERELEKILTDIRQVERENLPPSRPPSFRIQVLVEGLRTARNLKTYQMA